MKTPQWLLIVSLLFISVLGARANSEMFPSIGAAVGRIGWKDGYFIINGKPTYLSSGEIHYARVPRELWRDRLWRAKQMGLNCIQTYVFWNVSEPKEGQWDFSDNTDLDAWLSLVQELGMYATVRVGPYSCAEWDHGGFPAWLTLKKDMVVRDNDSQYLKYADEHMAKIYAIVAKHQIQKGGSVILVQLENEHPKGYGTQPYPYLNHLYEQARAAGLEIPMFFSGEHHSNEPIKDSIVTPGNSPWYTTEFYTGWLNRYGDMSLGSLRQTTRATWKIIAFGGAGYDYYVVHGGTNFGYSADVINLDPDLDVLALNGHRATATSRAPLDASYDYTAPIGEAGQFHNFYGPARQAAYFAQTFASLIATSSYQADLAKGTSPGVRVTPRQSPNGTVVFVDAFTQGGKMGIDPTTDDTTKVAVSGMGEFPRGGNLVIHPHSIRTLLFNLPWTPATKIESVSTNILLRHQIGSKELWVCYGEVNEYGEVTLNRTKPGAQTKYGFTYPSDAGVKEIDLDSGDGKIIELLVMNTAQANQTWLVSDRIIVGASFVREDGTIEFPPEGGQATVYASTGKSTVVANKIEVEPLPKLTDWAWREATAEKAVNYPDDKWLEAQGPQPLQYYDSFQNHYGWYRTTLHADAATTENLQIMGENGYFQPFLNGEPADFHKLALKPGDNKLAVFVKIGPRPKLGGFFGAVGTRAYSGLWGDYTTADKPIDTVVQWKKSSMAGSETELSKPEFDDRSWESVSYIQSAKETKLEQKTTWLRGTFQIPANVTRAFAYFPAVHGAIGARLFINGQVVEPSESKGFFSPWSLSDLIEPGTNTVALMITSKENNQATIEPKMEIWPTNPPTLWKFHGGLEGLEETAVIGRVTNWNSFMDRPWNQQGAPAPGLPTFWKVNFDYHPKNWETIGLVTTGLVDGHVWLNGHNLGESPQPHLMYMPECWLKAGSNSLVILDIAGTRPSQVTLDRYEVRQLVQNGVNSR